jgi:hypothetical protein
MNKPSKSKKCPSNRNDNHLANKITYLTEFMSDSYHVSMPKSLLLYQGKISVTLSITNGNQTLPGVIPR